MWPEKRLKRKERKKKNMAKSDAEEENGGRARRGGTDKRNKRWEKMKNEGVAFGVCEREK